LLSAAGRFLEVNQALCEFLGYSPAQLLLTSIQAVTHPDDLPAFKDATLRLHAGHPAALQLEQRYLRADGRAVPGLLGIVRATQDGSQSFDFIGQVVDLTARLETERLRGLPLAVSRALMLAPASDGLSQSILQTLAENSDWDAAGLWLVDRQANVLRLEQFWHAAYVDLSDLDTRQITCAREVGLPGHVWATPQPLWIVDLFERPDLKLIDHVAEAGLRTAVGFPILNGLEVAGVVDFYSRDVRQPDSGLLSVLPEIGSQLGHFIERTRMEGALEHIRAVLDNIADAVITTDEDGLIESFNRAAQRLLSYPRRDVLGQEAKMLLAEPYRGEFVTHLNSQMRPGKSLPTSGSREMWGRRRDGSTFPMEFRASEMLLAGKRRFVAILRDISDQKAQKEALEYQALHDALTGLPNRTLLSDRLRQALLLGHRERKPLVLLIMDMDRFKQVNDTLGHHVGDVLLQQVALRIEAVMRRSDTVARLGGDEFAILPLGGIDAEGGAHAARKILESLENPFIIEGRTIDVGASIGMAVFPEHGEDAETLMRHADLAMYVAKRSKRGYAIYRPQHDEHSALHLALIGELRRAIGNNELILHYQPKADLRSGKIQGVEALVRWQHPKNGLLLPDQFLMAAEETELVGPLTEWVLNQALQQWREWGRAGMHFGLAVNVSAWNLQDPAFVHATSELIGAWSVDPAKLRLEITESSIMATSAIESISQLSAIGIGLSIDDFGTGYSSLVNLKRLPVKEIKIDRSFVAGMREESENVSIVRPIIELGHNMGLEVVAEGVEDQATWDALVTLGCDVAQGFHVCPPMVAADFADWFQESPRGNGPTAAN
jgi:diguanylate cyclase (GGDEF)-like protein/PAS domain S-box-containing protein